MNEKSKIKIVSKMATEFISNLVINDITYHIQSEDMGRKKAKVSTKIFLKGEVVFSRNGDYSFLLDQAGFEEKLGDFMKRQHKTSAELFVNEQKKKLKQKSAYFNEIKKALRKGEGKAALEATREAVECYPEDPFFQSYYGCLTSVVEKRHREGILLCRNAIRQLEKTVPFGSEMFYPAFYLNLGRACLPVQKKEAYKSFLTGLQHDPENRELKSELQKMGPRKKPAVPFLKRSNPLNKYIGMMISKMSGQ